MNKNRPWSAMVIVNEDPIIISGWNSDNYGEIFKNGKWELTSKIPIPNQHSYFMYHSAVTVNNKIYTFGGIYNYNADYPVEVSYIYNSIEWTKSNGLLKSKYRLKSIRISNYIYHLGGRSNQDSLSNKLIEGWKNENDLFEKDVHDFQYTTTDLFYPEVIPVGNDFC